MTAAVAPAPGPAFAHDERNIVEVDGLEVHFPIRSGVFKSVKGTVKAVDGVTFEVRRGETLGLVGESGCGKSTIGRAMIRLREPTGGHVYFEGTDLGSLSNNALRKKRRQMAHRFALTYHRQLRSKAIRHSELDMVAGVGPALKKRLLETFGSLESMRGASLEALAKVKGVGAGLAERIIERLRGRA
jgi:ABC-type oligopeptide transport system ATPase subunit